MERETEQLGDCVDLGAATAETQGPMGPVIEPSAIGKLTGITDE